MFHWTERGSMKGAVRSCLHANSFIVATHYEGVAFFVIAKI